MNRMDEVLTKLCPQGVGYKMVGTMADVGTGSSNGNEAEEDGIYPFFIRSQTVKAKNDYEYDEEAIIIPGEGGIGEIYHYVSGKYALHQRVYRIHFNTDLIITKFAYYYFHSRFKTYIMKKAVSATVSSIRKPMIESFSIPVPPLEIQREIVRVLDSFTLLIAELTAELTAWKKQYEYYRDNLLCFNQDICQMRLSEVCESIADGDHMPPPKTEAGIPFITISNITANRKIDFAKTMFVSNDYYEKLDSKRKAQEEDILYTVVGSFGTPVYVESDRKFVFQRHIAILRPNKSIIKPKYLYHAMQSTTFYKQADTMARGAAQRTISLSSLGQMRIFVPALDVQERIVKILDNFDAICSDLNVGLPAEIEARQKQYEYYRDKLLTFKELSE